MGLISVLVKGNIQTALTDAPELQPDVSVPLYEVPGLVSVAWYRRTILYLIRELPTFRVCQFQIRLLSSIFMGTKQSKSNG